MYNVPYMKERFSAYSILSALNQASKKSNKQWDLICEHVEPFQSETVDGGNHTGVRVGVLLAPRVQLRRLCRGARGPIKKISQRSALSLIKGKRQGDFYKLIFLWTGFSQPNSLYLKSFRI
jgi:hypothetical protein